MLLMDDNDSGGDFELLAEQVKDICPDVITVMLSPYYYGSHGGSTESIDRIVAKDDGPDALLSHIEELLGKSTRLRNVLAAQCNSRAGQSKVLGIQRREAGGPKVRLFFLRSGGPANFRDGPESQTLPARDRTGR